MSRLIGYGNFEALYDDSVRYRGDMIRTCGPCFPKAVLYQAELHPVCVNNVVLLQIQRVYAMRRGKAIRE